MTAVLSFIAKLIVDVLASIFVKASTTPAVEEEIDVQEGDAPAPDLDYGAAYGLHNRDQGEG